VDEDRLQDFQDFRDLHVNPDNPASKCLTIMYRLRYKPEAMFSNTHHGHHVWHHHHGGGGLVIVFTALTEAT
jgi:hypothetical protein